MKHRTSLMLCLLLASSTVACAQSASSNLQIQRQTFSVREALQAAYAQLQAGKLTTAEQQYRQLIQTHTSLTPALLALAQIHAARQENGQASYWRNQAAVQSPLDPAAQASQALVALPDPNLRESRLKTLRHDHPDHPAVYLALGQTYGQQGRWPEAQEAFQASLRLDHTQPDAHFNLAICFEQLRQPVQAARHYQYALDQATQRLALFPANAARQRLAALQP